jgi:hypothetical protein
MTKTTAEGTGLTAGQWEKFFIEAKVRSDKLDAAKSAQGKAAVMASLLAANVDREVSIEVKGRRGKARLRMMPGRSRTKQYYFEICWDDPLENDAGIEIETVDRAGAVTTAKECLPAARRKPSPVKVSATTRSSDGKAPRDSDRRPSEVGGRSRVGAKPKR